MKSKMNQDVGLEDIGHHMLDSTPFGKLAYLARLLLVGALVTIFIRDTKKVRKTAGKKAKKR